MRDECFSDWWDRTNRFLSSYFGEESHEALSFRNRQFTVVSYLPSSQIEHSAHILACREGLEETLREFQTVLLKKITPTPVALPKIYIVHGSNEGLKHSIARLLTKQHLQPIIDEEEPIRNLGPLQRLELFGNVDAAICIFSADDSVMNKKTDRRLPSQDAIFQAGFFIGKLGREHVLFVTEDNLELPKFVPAALSSNTVNWEIELLKELNAMGITVDLNELM